MARGKRSVQTEEPIYAAIVPWLRPLLDDSSSALTSQTTSQHPSLEASENACGRQTTPHLSQSSANSNRQASLHTSSISAVHNASISPPPDSLLPAISNLHYLTHHTPFPQNLIPEILSLTSHPPYLTTAQSKKLAAKTTSARSAFLSKTLPAHVKEVERKWQVAHPWATFAKLADGERAKAWLLAFDEAPAEVVGKVFGGLVRGVVDVGAAFDGGLGTGRGMQEREKLRRVRQWLREKYFWGCEVVWKYGGRKDLCARAWTAVAERQNNEEDCVAVGDLPLIRRAFVSDVPREEVMDDAFDSESTCPAICASTAQKTVLTDPTDASAFDGAGNEGTEEREPHPCTSNLDQHEGLGSFFNDSDMVSSETASAIANARSSAWKYDLVQPGEVVDDEESRNTRATYDDEL